VAIICTKKPDVSCFIHLLNGHRPGTDQVGSSDSSAEEAGFRFFDQFFDLLPLLPLRSGPGDCPPVDFD
jgi:hypothetical protein